MSRDCKKELLTGKLENDNRNFSHKKIKLEEKGISLSFVINQMFHPNLVEAITEHYKKIEFSLSKRIASETWRSDGALIPGSIYHLTESAKYLNTSTKSFVSNITRILTFEVSNHSKKH